MNFHSPLRNKILKNNSDKIVYKGPELPKRRNYKNVVCLYVVWTMRIYFKRKHILKIRKNRYLKLATVSTAIFRLRNRKLKKCFTIYIVKHFFSILYIILYIVILYIYIYTQLVLLEVS